MYVNDRRESYETRQQLDIQMDVVNFTKRPPFVDLTITHGAHDRRPALVGTARRLSSARLRARSDIFHRRAATVKRSRRLAAAHGTRII